MIAEESNTSVLRAALTKLVGGNWKIEVEPAGSAAGPTRGRARCRAGARPARRGGREPPPPAPSDPEADAMRLLRDQLGATPIER